MTAICSLFSSPKGHFSRIAGVRWLAVILLVGIVADDLQAQGFARRWRTRRQSERCRSAPANTTAAAENWVSLFDGKSLGQWKRPNFGGEGEVKVENGQIRMDFGYSLNGVTYTGDVPKLNYEIRLEAMKVDGIDFFCGLTFPVADSHCSFIVGGWAGGVVGLSSIDGFDASENETTHYMTFDKNRWYKIRVRVEKENIQAWIDNKKVVDQDIKGRKISTRAEVDLSKPLGISAWETKSALRNIQIRRLRSDEISP